MTTLRGAPASKVRTGFAIASVLALVLAACPGWARSLNDQEKASLAATVESFNVAMREANFARVAETIPPKVIDALARRAGARPDQVVAAMIKAMQQILEGGNTRIESFGMDLGSADHRELASESPPYVLIPTETIIAVGGRRLRATSHTLALLDEGKWFLLRINEAAQLQMLLDAYPEFASVKFPSGSIEALNP
jgi:hypothetical protein